MDEKVKKYLEEKYGPNFIQNAESDYSQRSEKLAGANLFANLGDVIAGQKVGSLNPYFDKQQALAEYQTTGKIDRERKQALDEMNAKEQLEFRKLQMQNMLAEQQANRDLRRDLSTQARADRAQTKSDSLAKHQAELEEKGIQGLSKAVEGTQGAMNAIDAIESELGGPLETFTNQKGTLMKNGQAVDLPGVSIPMIGRVSAYSDEARTLASKAATVFNSVLKDRSGAAVTNSELERLKGEFGQGKYNTEAELVDALKNYKLGLAKELKNREAAYKPEVVKQYAERGGRTSMSLPKDEAQKVPVRKLQNKALNKTKIIYSDGTEEVIDGLK
jgi:hypothetical protein